MTDSAPPFDLPRLLDAEGRVVRWPTKERQKAEVIRFLASKFEPGATYREVDVNDTLKRHHTFGDWALLRRELYQRGYLDRLPDGTRYWRTALAS